MRPKTNTCVYLGCAVDSAADRFLDLTSNSVIESRDAVFFEDKFLKDKNLTLPGLPDTSSDTLVGTELRLPDTEPVTTSVVESTRLSNRERVPKNFGTDFVTYQVEADPSTYTEAMRSRDSLLWKEAIDDEINSLMANHTWTLVDLPKGAKTIGSKWVLRKKLNPDGSIAKYKARLVAKGFTQVSGIDYFDTYSPVCHIATIRVLLAIASIERFVVHQMDVKTAFLNGDLTEEIYMHKPEGFVVKGLENKV